MGFACLVCFGFGLLETAYLVKTFVYPFCHILALLGLLSLPDINIIKNILDEVTWLEKKTFWGDLMWLSYDSKKIVRKYLTESMNVVYICAVETCKSRCKK